MDTILITRFIMGWFDPLEKRIAHRTRQDAAINDNRSTTTVRTMKPEYWGMI